MRIRFFKNNEIYNITLSIVAYNIISLKYTEDIPSDILTSGFEILNENNNSVMKTYTSYTTEYRKIDNGVELSNDGSVYSNKSKEIVAKVNWNDYDNEDNIRPSMVDATLYEDNVAIESVVLSSDNNWRHTWNNLDENKDYKIEYSNVDEYELHNGVYSYTPLSVIRENKIKELSNATSETIYNGLEVNLIDGTTETFKFTDFVQQNITTAYNTANVLINLNRTDVLIPFYNSNNECKTYSVYDIIKIYLAMGSLITYVVSLDHQLELQIRTMTSSRLIKNITLSPDSLQSKYRIKFNELVEAGNKIINVVEETFAGTITNEETN